MTKQSHLLWCGAVAAAALFVSQGAVAAVSASEAEALKTTLTPLGGEKAGNKDGSIPPWTGGYTTPIPGFKNGGRRSDPFASEKPLYSITAKNMAQYADKLSDGAKAMLQKYPASYRIDVYPTHRTGAAPQWVYDNTFKNATRGKLAQTATGDTPEGVFGGAPFPIPKSGIEVVWNHLLRWRGESWHFDFHGVLVTAEGNKVLTVDALGDLQAPYYFKGGDPSTFDGMHYQARLINAGPPVRAGEGIVGRIHVNAEDQAWVYLTGQRRVRKLPNACCDSPTPATAGVMSFDELEVFSGKPYRFDWKLLGKKELIVPYNSNRTLVPQKDSDVLGANHVNPDHLRWELHRVWVVEATVKAGQRHQAHKGVYYFDEDTWLALLGDRWDARGQLWKTMWHIPVVMPDLPATVGLTFGFYDLVSNAWFTNVLMNEKAEQYKIVPRYPDSVFTADGLISEGIR